MNIDKAADLAERMTRLEEQIRDLDLDHLRSVVALGESLQGAQMPDLPSGNPFDRHTLRARLWLDFIDAFLKLDIPNPMNHDEMLRIPN